MSADKYARAYAQRRLQEIEAGTLMPTYPAPMQAIRFGNALLFVAVSGEPVVDYSLRVKRENRIEVGLALQYITTVIHPTPFAPNVEDRIVERINQLIQETAENPAE